jgi:hypothetical protein
MDQINQYLDLLNGLYGGSLQPFNGSVPDDLTALWKIALTTLVLSFVGGVVFGPLGVWSFPKLGKVMRDLHLPARIANVYVIQGIVVVGMLQFTFFSAVRLFMAHDNIVGLGVIPTGLLLVVALFAWWPRASSLPVWLTTGLYIVSVTLAVLVFGYGLVLWLTYDVLPTKFLWNLPFMDVIVGGVLLVLGVLVALVVADVDSPPS